MIASKDNDRLKLIRKLHAKSWRDKLGLFFVEGEDAVAAATAAPVDLLRAEEDVEAKLLADVASAPHPPRVVAVYRRADLPAWEERDATLALWRLADPGNVGTLIRTADAFGAAVALSDGCADPTSPKALRASAGSIWRVPLGHWPEGASSNRLLQSPPSAAPVEPPPSNSLLQGAVRVALDAHRGTVLAELDLSGRVVFLLGAEREGLPADVERDVEARIPISGAESLNVAAAGAIALYEWRRQTQTESSPPVHGEPSNQP
ncbi:MAG: RNA methyltransferase [Gaiellaceae bacterium]